LTALALAQAANSFPSTHTHKAQLICGNSPKYVRCHILCILKIKNCLISRQDGNNHTDKSRIKTYIVVHKTPLVDLASLFFLRSKTKVDNGISTKSKTSLGKRLSAIIAALFMLALFVFNSAALAQTQLPPPGGDFNGAGNGTDLSQGASQTQTTAERIYDAPGQTTLVREQAEQNTTQVAQSVEQKLWPAFGSYNDVYQGLSAFWGDDIISNFFANIGQLIGKWLSEFINGWIADAVQFLTGFLRIFVLNPNIATNGLAASGGPADDISPYIRQGADIMYGIAVDLLLLLFILCIWKYWAEAAWRGGGNLMGAVGRLIFTAGLMLAWPTIYAFEIQITNEMIKAVYFNSADQVAMLDAAMAAAVKAGLVAGAGLLANATAPIGGQVFGGLLAGGAGGIVLGTVGGFVAFVGLIIYLIVGGILVAELIYILVLKAIQTALLCAQYMFAPIFLVFFALPDTENVTSGFVRSFVEVSLWTFVWVGMLKILVVVVLSDFNPWGKIVMAVGVLQLMIQVPSFLARAQISPMSDFVSAGLVTGGILGAGKALSNVVSNRGMHLANAIGNFGFAGAKGAPKSQSVDLNSPNDVANPDLLKKQRQASSTGTVDGQGQKLNPADEAKKKADEAKKAEAAKNGPAAKKDQNNPMGTPPGQAAALNPDGTPKTPAEAEAAKQKQAEMAAMLGQKLADRNNAGTPGATPPKANDPATAANLASTTGTPPVGGTGAGTGTGTGAGAGSGTTPGTTPGANPAGAKLDPAASAAAAAAALAAKNNTGVPKVGDPNALEGKTDATVKNKADGANAATTNANAGKPLTPEDAAKAAAANVAGNAGLVPPGGKPKDGQVEVEGTNTPAGGVAGAQAGKLNTTNGDPSKANAPGQVGPDGEKSTIKAPGTPPGGAALTPGAAVADTNLVPKPGITPANAVPPGNSAQLAEAAKGINRGTADFTTKAGSSDVTVEGDAGAPLSQVSTKDAGKIVGTGAAPIIGGAILGAGAALAGAKIGGQGQQPGANVNAETTTNVNQLPGQNGNVNPQLGANGLPINPAALTGTGANAGGQLKTQGGTTDVNVEGDANNPNSGAQVTTSATGRVVNPGGGSLIPPPGIVPSTSAAAMAAGRLASAGAPGVNVDTTANVNQLPGQNSGINATPQLGANGLPINPGSLNTTGANQLNQGRTQTGTADINVEGESIGQNGQVVTNATGRVVSNNPAQAAANMAAGAVLGAGAAVVANRMGGNNNQTQQQNIDIQAQGIGNQGAPTAPPTQFTAAHRVVGNAAGAGSPPPPSNIDGTASMDDGSGNGGGGFSGGTLPPIGSGGKPAPPNPNDPRPDMFNNHHQAGYNKVPFRVAAANARLAQGATIGTSNTGSDYVVYDNQGHAMHYRFAEGATQERKAMGMIAGSLGELMSTDAEAYDSARQSAIDAGEHKPQGAMERIAAGILAYNGSSWTQTAAAKQRFARSMAKHANLGSQAYVNGGPGNAYTQFLENRYGHMDDEKQAEAVHIMTTDDTPESGWSWRLQPSTEALIQNGIGISPVNRACAANMAVLKAQPWLRGAAIRGSAAYMESKANSSLPDDTHPMVKNSWYAHHAQAMSPETVNCVGALTLASGDANICRDSAMVDQVVSMVPSGGRPEDYVGAYNALQTGSRVVKSMMAPRSGAASVGSVRGGGGGGGFSGGGGSNNAEMEVIVENGSSSGGSFNPASVNLGGIGGNNGINDTRVDVRTSNQSSPGANLGTQTVRVPGGSNSPGQVRMGSMSQSGGGPRNQDDQVTVDVEIGSSGAPGASADDIQRAALNSALQYFGGNSTELVKTVTANLVASGMSYNDMNNPNLMKTAIQSYATNPTSMPQVALAANAVGPANVKPQHVEIVQNMQDNDPRWDSRSITPQAMYTATAIMEAHQANPQAYGPAYLTQEYVQKVASYPGFRPREMPMRGANGQVSYQERTPVPAEVILNHLADKMRRFGNVQ